MRAHRPDRNRPANRAVEVASPNRNRAANRATTGRQLRCRFIDAMRYQEQLTVPVVIHRDGPTALHRQIAAQLGAAVDGGLLMRGSRVPSTRTLADLLGVSRGVATAAYEELFARGYLVTRRGSGTYVDAPRALTTGRTTKPAAEPTTGHATGGPCRPEPRPAQLLDLTPGPSGLDLLAGLPAWRAAWREASLHRQLAPGQPTLGLPWLRRAVADHLLTTRGLRVSSHQVLITGGIEPGISTALTVLAASGLEPGRTAVPEPGSPALLRAIDVTRRYPVPVDDAGVRVDAIPPGCRTVLVSPDGQGPLGTVLSAARRRELAAWALDTGGYLLETADDTLIRPEASRLPRLSDLVPDRVIRIGELLVPALGVGYLLLPEPLASAVLTGTASPLFAAAARPPLYVSQLAAAALLRDGTAVRLMHRRARLSTVRRHLVETALAPLRHVELVGGAPGTAVVRLTGTGYATTPHLPAATARPAMVDHLVSALRFRGVRVSTLDDHHVHPRSKCPALVLGYAHQPEDEFRRALAILVDVLAGLDPGGPQLNRNRVLVDSAPM